MCKVLYLGLNSKCLLAFGRLEGSFILVDPWRQFLLKMSGHGLSGKHKQFLCTHNNLTTFLSSGCKKEILSYTLSLILVVSAKWLLKAIHLDDISFTFVHLHLHLLVNHRPRWSLMLNKYIRAIILTNHESSPFIGKSVPKWENSDNFGLKRLVLTSWNGWEKKVQLKLVLNHNGKLRNS